MTQMILQREFGPAASPLLTKLKERGDMGGEGGENKIINEQPSVQLVLLKPNEM